jgi:2-oxoglutarate ferredoxin oxidoreductase subunit beta
MDNNQVTETASSHASDYEPTWCPGCGNYAVLKALDVALGRFGCPPYQVTVVSGICCSSPFPYLLGTYSIQGIHGRALPLAAGLKTSRPDLTVVVTMGDGDALSIGGNHFLHALPRNVDLTCIIMDNRVYGMTKGQFPPTNPRGFVTKSSPYGMIDQPIESAKLALTLGATFVALGASYEPGQLADLFLNGLRHRGMAIINVLSPCRTFNCVNTPQFYRRACRPVPHDHDPGSLDAAMGLLRRIDDHLPLGLIYRREGPTFPDRLPTPLQNIELRATRGAELAHGFV